MGSISLSSTLHARTVNCHHETELRPCPPPGRGRNSGTLQEEGLRVRQEKRRLRAPRTSPPRCSPTRLREAQAGARTQACGGAQARGCTQARRRAQASFGAQARSSAPTCALPLPTRVRWQEGGLRQGGFRQERLQEVRLSRARVF